MRRALAGLTVALASACSDDPAGAPLVLGLPEPAFGAQLAVVPFSVPPHSEKTECRYLTLPASGDVDVQRFESRMRPGSHHFVLYRSLAPIGDFQGPCLMDLPRAVLYGAQTEQAELAFPPRVAMRLPRGSALILEAHFINPSDTPTTGEVVANLHFAESVGVDEYADVLFFINRDITIPPQSTWTTQKTCPLPAGANVFLLSSHTHRRGTAFTMDLVGVATGDLLRHLYDNYNWQDPRVVRFPDAAPLAVGAGQGLRFACTYRNDDGVTVRWGFSSEDEMCIAFGLYYPSQGIRYCF